jgi:hypothetical protein
MFHCILYIPVDGVGVGCVLPVKINMGDGYGYQFEEDFTYIMAFRKSGYVEKFSDRRQVTSGKRYHKNTTMMTYYKYMFFCFVCLHPVFCVLNVARISRLSIPNCSFGFL